MKASDRAHVCNLSSSNGPFVVVIRRNGSSVRVLLNLDLCDKTLGEHATYDTGQHLERTVGYSSS